MAAFGQTVFDTYEEEANTSLASFEQELAQSAVYAGNEKAAKLHNAEVLLAQVKDVLDQMAIEVRTVPRKERAPYEQRKAAVQTAYDDAQRKLKKTREDANKAKLLGAGAGAAGVGAVSMGQRERMVNANASLSQQNETLENARRVMADTEDTGLDIMAQLSDNREKIDTAHGRVKEELGMLQNANGLVTRMSKWWNRW